MNGRVTACPGDRRIDTYPTHRHGDWRLRPGRVFPFGATLVPGGVNFSIFSRHATTCTLVLFERGEQTPIAEIPFPVSFRIGHVWSMIVFDIEPESIEYGYRMDGPNDPRAHHRFDPGRILLDPYAKAVGGRDRWGETPNWTDDFPHRGRLVFEDFDWEDERPLQIPIADLLIYEMHVRSFTAHPSAGVRFPGTYAGIVEKISYLVDLGINCVELMPVFEFDEFENSRISPKTGEALYNYWGYGTVNFFSPKAGFAASGSLGMQVDELKTVIKELHRAGIEVILDVVFNHTAEGNENGPTLSFRGLDNQTYYMLRPDGSYFNFSGCGNTLNCNNPIVRGLVLDCLRYWAADYHVDGFRFDLASILGRDPWGSPMANPPLLESLAFDPILGKCKLIAEAWDAGGLYQVGSFPDFGRWAEWNGKYRDDIRRFLKGDGGVAGAVAQRLSGSPDLYGWNRRGPTASINFITCHDGFTLRDLFSYDSKHNEDNGEDNRDGSNENHSWNCGIEGETTDDGINALRLRLIRYAWVVLLVSQGVPMVLMGDEVGRSKRGNNNTYCQDNDLNWMDWTLVEREADLLRFASMMIALRKAHPALRQAHHLTGRHDTACSGYSDISWHGTRVWNADWSPDSRTIAFMLAPPPGHGPRDDFIYVALNSHWAALPFELPALPADQAWHIAVNSGMKSPEDIHVTGAEPRLQDQGQVLVGGRSAVVLVGR